MAARASASALRGGATAFLDSPVPQQAEAGPGPGPWSSLLQPGSPGGPGQGPASRWPVHPDTPGAVPLPPAAAEEGGGKAGSCSGGSPGMGDVRVTRRLDSGYDEAGQGLKGDR